MMPSQGARSATAWWKEQWGTMSLAVWSQVNATARKMWRAVPVITVLTDLMLILIASHVTATSGVLQRGFVTR